MTNTFYTWDSFKKDFGRHMREACELYEQMMKGDGRENALARFDVSFDSDQEDKLAELRTALIERYDYEIGEIEPDDDRFVLNGAASPFPLTEENLMYWVLDMAALGLEFDAELSGYGAEMDGDDSSFPDLASEKEDEYFDAAMADYESGNRSAAIFNWSLAIAINPDNPDSYYSRAIVKNELHTWKAALRDYDKAIDLAPDYLAALLNRGSVKDENGDPKGAIADYDRVIAAGDDDLEQKAMAYFNRGNSKFQLKDAQGACEDWKQARELGADYANERIQQHCGDG